MEDIVSNFDLVLSGFWITLQLAFWSALGSLVIGALLVAMRVGPVRVLALFATSYVNIVRNTPLLVIFILVFAGFPALDLLVGTPFLVKGIVTMTIYTSPFVCEALRAGVNSVQLGQAEAARAIGMTFGQTMTQVVLPQAVRASVPPLTSVIIAMTKNTSIAAVFGLAEATARMRGFTNNNADDRILIFLVFALGYIVIVEAISGASWLLERRWRTVR
ncbi:amino acid ABC transporter permease [uncultured Nocardioides sp.]|uniref:amino acid ABC transporter permease n=1 Tax=uncultured Nocardioides sp. TaxID=198441 RepID=UPI0026216105|nr:amino acid ABC transporter permease [uncultured Nocardioides sp.]